VVQHFEGRKKTGGAENRRLRRIFRPHRDDFPVKVNQLYEEELHNCTHEGVFLKWMKGCLKTGC
jgi:hypothetical protein